MNDSTVNLYIGTERPDGLFQYHFDVQTGQLEHVAQISGTVSPMYLTLNQAKTRLYAVQETSGEPEPSVAVFALDAEGRPSLMNLQAALGASPCHLTLDPSESFVLVANYTQGNIVLFALADDGSLLPSSHQVQHQGSSVNPNRQQEAHAHSVVFDNEGTHLLAADLGIDKILSYRLNAKAQQLEAVDACAMPPGSGPRHLCFSPDGSQVYVINELSNTVAVMRYKEGKLTFVKDTSTLPDGYQGESYCSAIKLSADGTRLYASNRGHDSIAVFQVDAANEALELLNIVPLEGKWPRDMTLDPSGQFLLVGHQHSDSIAVYRTAESGELALISVYDDIPAPGCLLFAAP